MSFAFVAESTLGKLAKWLRILGFDTIYAPEGLAEAMPGANGRPRIYLTRTRKTAGRKLTPAPVFIVSDKPFEQLKEVIDAVGITPADLKLFSLCLRCNIATRQVDRSFALGKVPDHILETHHSFQTCSGCGRIYWPGSHIQHSRKIIDSLFE